MGRGVNAAIGAAEALQLIGGFSDPEWLCKIAPAFEKFREDISLSSGGHPIGELTFPWFHGAYGTRVAAHDQLRSVVARLHSEPHTRQAVVTLWDPEVDVQPLHLDYPCTVALGFSVTGRRLNARVTMRSNDAWLGLPYDMFQFTQLQLTLCHILALSPGTYTHTAWSLHLYEENVAASYEVVDRATDGEPIYHPAGIGHPGGGNLDDVLRELTHVQTRAADLRNGRELVDATDSERWYLDVLKSFA